MARARLTPSDRPRLRRQLWLTPLLLLLLATLPHLDQGGFRTDTGKYAAFGLQAWKTGSLWTIYAEPGELYFNKPPLGLWIHGFVLLIGEKLTGISLVWARLPSIAAAGVCVLLTIATARTMATRQIALSTGIILALTYEFFRRSREISLDLWQVMFMLGAVWLVARGVSRRQWSLLALSGIPIGLGLMCKPLMILGAPVILAIWIVAIGEARRLGWLALGLVIALTLAAPWHISMAMQHGDAFTGQYFGSQVIERAAGEGDGQNESAGSVFYYLSQIVRNYWPWLIPLLLGLLAWVLPARRRFLPRLGCDNRLMLLAVLWSGIWLIALSLFPDQRPRYAIMIYPGLAIIAGAWVGSSRLPAERKLRLWFHRWAGPTAVVLTIVISLIPIRVQSPPAPEWDDLHSWIKSESIHELWQGGFPRHRMVRMYLEHGWWPVPTHDQHDQQIAEPPREALIIYHLDDGLAPDLVTEAEVFRSGKIVVTRLTTDAWTPISTRDPKPQNSPDS